MKINLKDKDQIDNNTFSLKKVAKNGIAFGLAIGIGLSLVSSNFNDNDNNDIATMIDDKFIEVSSDNINDMNIIINDSNCSDTFFNEVCEELRNDGLKFSTTSDNMDINKDNSVVITLDQQYSSGEATLIFAPYDNTRLGYSDSLTLSMQSAFLQNGFFADELSIGKFGFKENEDGTVTNVVPTDTESAIDSNYDTSFVTISFGTVNVNAHWVAKSIENGLARQKYYLDNYDADTDLLYRADANEDVGVVAKYFDATTHDLNLYNNLSSDETLKPQVIVNPRVCYMTIFDKNTQLHIDDVKTRAY